VSDDRDRTALLILHMQQGVVDQFGDKALAATARCREAVDAASAHDLPVIFVRLLLRAGLPELQATGRSNPFMAIFDEGAPSSALHELLTGSTGAFDVVNKRASAFKGGDLGELLRTLDRNHVVLAGIGTSGVVLGTVIEAADLDYRVTVLSDGCADPDDDVHRMLCESVFSVRGDVCTTADWISTLD
jgi:nicotinamidase-related amidase